ncbi:TPA: LysE family translocator [Vibrio diabolicus]|jgi:threonine/homoserine/homoserine lactone efflux protein|uniref:LysE family translocator n=1 Tax=Vibrio diabolicus TaxID=50719 RepID=A0AA92R8W1_9VIBR|nr:MULTISPECIES: LysE family translocator [Vibrio]KOY46078.1 threonine transporter RhtB [Vibrio parahaemolyticus]MCR9981668.1 LysE family translocator [Vibrio alginolyticus]MCQ9243874.1 LysE family translocator [Vibrio diabolicus]MCR9310886.1 LysE family translocator [Vibrio diabolicus]MCR9366755.1 LysE family translocator [Vibrio antiquarius]
MNLALLSMFIPTFFFVSITPGMCMTLALTLGMSIGYRRTLWMMIGELVGVALVSVSAVLGIAAIMLNYPWMFIALKFIGGGYLLYLGVEMWRSRGKLAINVDNLEKPRSGNVALIMQGFVTAIANPKGWAFMISLLPPFIDQNAALAPQLIVLVSIILLFEFICMSLYATGGKGLKRVLGQSKNVRLMNRIAGTLMMGVGVWLLLS